MEEEAIPEPDGKIEDKVDEDKVDEDKVDEDIVHDIVMSDRDYNANYGTAQTER